MIYEFQCWGFGIDIDGNVSQPVLPNIQDNDSFICCNLAQYTDVKIFEGIKGLQFKDCNLVNCDLPNDAETDSCQTAKIVYEVVDA